MRPSRATRVSTPSTRASREPAATARALRRAFSAATASGSPSSSSSTPETTMSKAIPSWPRMARRWGDPEARISGPATRPLRRSRTPSGRRPAEGSTEVGEEQADLARGRLGRVRAVHHVLANLDGEVAADRSGRRLNWIGGPDDLAGGLDGADAL